MLELISDPKTWVALASLTALEIVLGIDNIIFIAILTARVPQAQRGRAYRLGLGGAMLTRVGLLFSISWVMGLSDGLFTLLGEEISGRDLILIVGGLFLIAKSATEIYAKVEGDEKEPTVGSAGSFASVIVQIMLLDIVFSLDSVITAVGMVNQLAVMVTAIVVAIGVMLLFAQSLGEFVNRNPSIKILALTFLMMIGVLLTAEGFDQHFNKGYVYFAMGFAVLVELLNIRLRRRQERRAEPTPK